MTDDERQAMKRFVEAFDAFLATNVMQALCFRNPHIASDPRTQEMLSAHELCKAHFLISENSHDR